MATFTWSKVNRSIHVCGEEASDVLRAGSSVLRRPILQISTRLVLLRRGPCLVRCIVLSRCGCVGIMDAADGVYRRGRERSKLTFDLLPSLLHHHRRSHRLLRVSMDPIHQAAYDGDAAQVARLVQEDGERLNAGTRGCFCMSGFKVTPLMYGACMGHDAVVERGGRGPSGSQWFLGGALGLQLPESINPRPAAECRGVAQCAGWPRYAWKCCWPVAVAAATR